MQNFKLEVFCPLLVFLLILPGHLAHEQLFRIMLGPLKQTLCLGSSLSNYIQATWLQTSLNSNKSKTRKEYLQGQVLSENNPVFEQLLP